MSSSNSKPQDDAVNAAWNNLFGGGGGASPSAPVGTMYELASGDQGGGTLHSNLPGGGGLDPNGSGPLAVRGNAGWFDRDGNPIGPYGGGGGLPWGIGPGLTDTNGNVGPASQGAPLLGAPGLSGLLQSLQARRSALFPNYQAPNAGTQTAAMSQPLQGLLGKL